MGVTEQQGVTERSRKAIRAKGNNRQKAITII